jgi:hypothetical protein
MRSFEEPARVVPLIGECDVLVAGGGPAGVCAALAAARLGAKTSLIETHGCLGGVWTVGALSWILDSANKSGLLHEIIARLEARCGTPLRGWGGVPYDVEAMKLTLEEMCLESGVCVRLHTRVTAAARDENNRLSFALTESKSGREAWSAKTFVDATGDGDLAAQAGCGFDFGRENDGATQPMSLMALLSGVTYSEIHPFVHNNPDDEFRATTKRLLDVLATQGVTPSYGSPIILRLRDNFFAMMANHEYEASALNADDLTRATLRARAEVNRIVDALRAAGGVWQNIVLVATGAQIGVREGRRVHGRYTVTREDLISGARHDDAVCRVTFPVDVHSPKTSEGKSYGNSGVRAQPYDIPLRALIARDVDGLLLAGRCISGDFLAHASYRVTGNACALGQAAGITAALAAQRNQLPHEVSWHLVRAALVEQGCFFG